MFEPGHGKVGGRKKNTPNKKTRELEKICLDFGIDFFKELLKIAQNPDHPHYFAAIKEGCQYMYPKRKAIEQSSAEMNEIRVILEDYTSNSKT